MGVSISATNSIYDFDMGYGGFFNLRKNIALALDEEFGENYALLGNCYTIDDYNKNDMVANSILERKHLDEDVVDFLYASDTEGKISYKVCGKIYNLIKDIDFGDKGFRYAIYRRNDYEEFKKFLKDCYSKRKNMVWY